MRALDLLFYFYFSAQNTTTSVCAMQKKIGVWCANEQHMTVSFISGILHTSLVAGSSGVVANGVANNGQKTIYWRSVLQNVNQQQQQQ